MSPSLWQILIVVLIVFLLFGSKRLPTMMEDLAKAARSFKRGMAEGDDAAAAPPKKLENRPPENEGKG